MEEVLLSVLQSCDVPATAIECMLAKGCNTLDAFVYSVADKRELADHFLRPVHLDTDHIAKVNLKEAWMEACDRLSHRIADAGLSGELPVGRSSASSPHVGGVQVPVPQPSETYEFRLRRDDAEVSYGFTLMISKDHQDTRIKDIQDGGLAAKENKRIESGGALMHRKLHVGDRVLQVNNRTGEEMLHALRKDIDICMVLERP